MSFQINSLRTSRRGFPDLHMRRGMEFRFVKRFLNRFCETIIINEAPKSVLSDKSTTIKKAINKEEICQLHKRIFSSEEQKELQKAIEILLRLYQNRYSEYFVLKEERMYKELIKENPELKNLYEK